MTTGMIRLKPDAFGTLLRQHACSKEEAAHKSGLTWRTIARLVSGEPVRPTTVQVAFKLFGIEDFSPYLLPEDPLDEWVEETVLAVAVRAQNGLEYRVSRMRHTVLPGQWGRGKCYNIAAMSDADQAAAQDILLRHARVCRTVPRNPHVAVNLSCPPSRDKESWWVIDEWVEGRTLEAHLHGGPLPPDLLQSVGKQTALALEALHGAEVICRHLNPQSILIRDADRAVILTDFELAKLIHDAHTVRPKAGFRPSPFLAPEVSDKVDRRADFYSWGRVFLTAALGEVPKQRQEEAVIRPDYVPPTVWDLAVSCCKADRTARPATIGGLLKVLSGWK